MPISFVIPITPSNIVWDDNHTNFSKTALDTAGNHSKLCYLDSNGDIQWVAWDDIQISNLETYATYGSLPVTGQTNVLYFITGYTTFYRWTGSAYVDVHADYLKLSGGTMAGTLNMNGNVVSGCAYIDCDYMRTQAGTNVWNAINYAGNFGMLMNIDMTTKNISNCTTMSATNVNPTNLGACTLGGHITGNSKNITGLNTLSATTVTPTTLSGCTMGGNLSFNSAQKITNIEGIESDHIYGCRFKNTLGDTYPIIHFNSLTIGSGKGIDSRTTSGATTHHIKCNINGTDFWIAGSTAAPS